MGRSIDIDPNPAGRVFNVRFDGSVVDVEQGRNVNLDGLPNFVPDPVLAGQ